MGKCCLDKLVSRRFIADMLLKSYKTGIEMFGKLGKHFFAGSWPYRAPKAVIVALKLRPQKGALGF